MSLILNKYLKFESNLNKFILKLCSIDSNPSSEEKQKRNCRYDQLLLKSLQKKWKESGDINWSIFWAMIFIGYSFSCFPSFFGKLLEFVVIDIFSLAACGLTCVDCFVGGMGDWNVQHIFYVHVQPCAAAVVCRAWQKQPINYQALTISYLFTPPTSQRVVNGEILRIRIKFQGTKGHRKQKSSAFLLNSNRYIRFHSFPNTTNLSVNHTRTKTIKLVQSYSKLAAVLGLKEKKKNPEADKESHKFHHFTTSILSYMIFKFWFLY